MLDDVDGAELSLRAIARKAGVSRAAPYHHFADKDALLAATAAAGFKQLRSEMTSPGLLSENNPLRKMQDMGVAYVLFAVHHPRLYRLMFSGELSDRDNHPELKTEADATYEALGSAMARSNPGIQSHEGAGESMALGAWALVHGLSTLLIDGRVGGKDLSDEQVESIARNTTRIIGRGIAG